MGFLACLPFYSYSSQAQTETVYGVTQNAANPGLAWVMNNVLPQQAGLTVGNVIYQYSTDKNAEDDLLVHVQNENAQGAGYIFRETDDWSGLPGNTIRKTVPVANIPIELWGDGSIEVEGKGTVGDASVFYTYQYDPCFDPQTNPQCPGYKDPFDLSLQMPEAYDPLDDEFIQDELDRKATLKDEDQNDRDRKRVQAKEKVKESLEKLLGDINSSALAQANQAKHDALSALVFMPTSYYDAIPGGDYQDKLVLKDANLPDNRKGRRSEFAQQVLHEQMVNSQYEKK